jgi:hypothetical protein
MNVCVGASGSAWAQGRRAAGGSFGRNDRVPLPRRRKTFREREGVTPSHLHFLKKGARFPEPLSYLTDGGRAYAQAAISDSRFFTISSKNCSVVIQF